MATQDNFIQNNSVGKYQNNVPLLAEYVSRFLQNSSTSGRLGDTRTLLYRGHSKSDYALTPSVFRDNLLSKEHVIIQELLLKSPDDFSNIPNPFERLVKMQHYGLPTRLIDITTNPLTALYFACVSNDDHDGEVIVFYDYLLYPNDKNVISLANLSEYSGSSKKQMTVFLTDRGVVNPEIEHLTDLHYLPVMVPMNNERIKRQHGAFIIAGFHGEEVGNPFQKAVFDLKPEIVKDFEDDIPRSITIPKEDKKDVLMELDSIGINRAFLFPELEHQTAYIRQKYSDQELTNEQNKLISLLAQSRNFETSHSFVNSLNVYSSWNTKQVNDLCEIAKTNSQVGQILGDSDVYDFYKTILSGYLTSTSNKSVEWVKERLLAIEEKQEET